VDDNYTIFVDFDMKVFYIRDEKNKILELAEQFGLNIKQDRSKVYDEANSGM
jgi:hypothetical protein